MPKAGKKNRYFSISLYIIIPLIVAGLAALAAIVSFRMTEYYLSHDLEIGRPIFWGIMALTGVTFLIGLVVVRLLIKPMEIFVDQAKKLPALSGSQVVSLGLDHGDQLQHYAQVFRTVTDVLSRVDARKFFPEITGESRAMRGVLSQILKVAPTDSTVLILGQSGTGKELVADSIHERSARKGKRSVAINCAAIPPELLESELFGHEKGAFSGAVAQKPGKFEIADGGTVFLDEIGDMPLPLQGKMLRVIQQKTLDRVGGTRPVKVDLRFIAATNKNLAQMVEEGSFREDLYYRLNVVTLYLPTLRERKEDIPLLLDLFLQQTPDMPKMSAAAMQLLMAYHWPGNIRELENTIEGALVMSQGGDTIEPKHLPAHIARGVGEVVNLTGIGQTEEGESGTDAISIDDQLREIEKGLIADALRKTGGVQVKAAAMLAINPRSLSHRIKKYRIDVESYKK